MPPYPDMTQIVEARSLAVLTTLAADPPLYPHNPTHSPHGPLALYIVRVPGSKDVFLTPMKPRDKVVNAQDVQSSLYYLHVDEPDDAALMTVDDETRSFPPTSTRPYYTTSSDASQITRKPLPTPPISPVDESDEPWRARKPQYGSGVPNRKPVMTHPSSSPYPDLPQIPPRPSYRSSTSFDNSRGLGISDNRRPLPEVPPHRQNIGNQCASRSSVESRREPSAESNTMPSKEPVQFSLTLIRRDPSSGAQWNVAKIYDPPVQEVSSESTTDSGIYRAKRAGAPLFVDISNPGYSKFIHFDGLRPRSGNSAEGTESGGQSDGVFRRRLWMDGSKFADHSYTQRNQSSMDGNRPSRKSLQLSAQDLKASSRAVVDRRSRGYSFRSPWGGKCEFVTGVSGRSLKCRHHAEGQGGHSAEVSELRFNLPGSGGAANAGGDRSIKRSSFIPRLPLHKHTPSNDSWDAEMPDEPSNYFDEDGNINLALGQERAGGGFHGKRAKLGKLIVDEMGLRMLDLIVAANMGLWWRAYERA